MTNTASRYRWVILAVLWMTYLVVFLNRLSVGPLAPFLKGELGISSAQVGMVVSAAAFGYIMTQIPVGWVVDRVGARWPIAIGELIAGTAMIILFFTPSFTWLLLFMVVTGMGCGFLQPSTTQGVVVWFPPRERATVMGFKQTAVNIGGIISATTLPVIALALGWRYGFLFLGIMSIAIGIAAFSLYKEPRRDPSISKSAASASAVPLLDIIRNREIWLVAAGCIFLTWVEFAVISHLVLYLTEVLLFSVVVAGGILAMCEAAGAIIRPVSGFLSDRVFAGKRKPIFIWMAGTASAMSLIISLFGPSLSWVIYPVIFLMGLGAIGFGGIYFTLVAELAGPRGAGKAAGMASTVTMAGTILGPIVFGHIVDVSGSYKLAWLSLAVLGALSALLLTFVKEEKRKI